MAYKILYIGNYRDHSGYGDACLHNLNALSTTDLSIACRPITFDGFSRKSVPNHILHYEQTDLHNIDAVVYHTLPHLYSYDGNFKNIGIFYSETTSLKELGWNKYINLMDQLIVPQVTQSDTTKVYTNKRVDICPIPLDIKAYQNLELSATINDLSSSFNFLFVGELNKRKNLSALLQAFYTEFHPSEPVNLLLKLSDSRLTSEQLMEKFEELDQKVQNGLKIRKKYKKVGVLCGHYEKIHLLSFMRQCHCYVCPSYGEAWCIPAIEAASMGLPLIYTKNNGMDHIIPSSYPIESTEVPCYGYVDSLEGLYTSNNSWYEISISHLSARMRDLYNLYQTNNQEYVKISEKTKSETLKYDYAHVGPQLKELICQPLNK